MALEISPSARGALVFGSLAFILVWWMASSGALTTLLVIAIAVSIVAFLFWALGVRIARWGAGL